MKVTAPFVCLGILILFSSASASGSEREEVWQSQTPQPIPKNLIGPACIDDKLGVLHLQCAQTVIRFAINARPHQAAFDNGKSPADADPFYIIHLVRWRDMEKTQAVDTQHWYVYHAGKAISKDLKSGATNPAWSEEDFSSKDRVYGKRQIYLLYLHVNKDPMNKYGVRYTLRSKSKTPAYLDHALGLLQLFIPQGKAGGGAGDPRTMSDFHAFQTYYLPSDLTITPELGEEPNVETSGPTGEAATSVTPPQSASLLDGGNSADASGPSASPVVTTPSVAAPDTAKAKLDAHTFDNEGLYRTDFTVGIPVKKISELQYVGASSTLTPAKVEKTNLFGLFDYYLRPVDIKSTWWSPWPHLVAGVAIDSKPLQKSLIGIGYGPLLAHFYAGLLLHTYQLPSDTGCGGVPSSAQLLGKLKNKTCPEFSFGINVSVGSVMDALKPKKAATSGGGGGAQ